MDSESSPVSAPQPREVFASIMGGFPIDHCVQQVNLLPTEDRVQVLCTVCVMRAEIAANCLERVADMDKVLTLACPYYADGSRQCVELAR